jgi:uncharacterized protein YukE
VPQPIRVTPADLSTTAGKVNGHAEDIQVRHAAADGRIEAAQTGLPAGSAAALSATVAKWQTDSAALFSQLAGHAEAFHTAAANYEGSEQHNADAVAALGKQAATDRDL